MPSLKKRSVVVIDNFDLNIFQFNIGFCDFSAVFYVLNAISMQRLFFFFLNFNNRSHYTVTSFRTTVVQLMVRLYIHKIILLFYFD